MRCSNSYNYFSIMDIENLKDVIVIEKDELALGYRYEPEARELNGITVCSYEYDLPDLLKKYTFFPCNPQIGDVYAKSPFYENVYISICDYRAHVVQSKSRCMSNVARLLGATSYHSKIVLGKFTERKWTVGVGVEYKSVEGGVDITQEIQDSLKIKSEVNMTYETKGVTQADYDDARQQAEQYRLSTNPNIVTLLEQRNPQSSSLLKSMNVNVSLSEEVNRSLDVAFRLNAMAGVFKLSSDFNLSLKKRYDITEMIEINF